jgi:uncharacterized protein
MLTMLFTAAILGLAEPQGDVRYPARPGPREFILDDAELLPAPVQAEIRTLCDETLTQQKVPIVVVTITSLANVGAGSWPIERYAMNLMAEWGIGWEDWNYGMLLLVSPGDRKARIELGGSWARRKDEEARRVMSQRIVPLFKRGDFANGILEGVKGLRAIALELGAPAPGGAPAAPSPSPTELPPPSTRAPEPNALPGLGGGSCSMCSLPVIIGVIVAVIVLSRVVGGRGVTTWGGSGPGFYRRRPFGSGFGGGLIGGALGGLLYDTLRGRSSRGHGGSSGSSGSRRGSFGGGSFGGGFSGGGGATGSW